VARGQPRVGATRRVRVETLSEGISGGIVFALKDRGLFRVPRLAVAENLFSCTWLRAVDGSIPCAGDTDSRLGSIADRCDTSRAIFRAAGSIADKREASWTSGSVSSAFTSV